MHQKNTNIVEYMHHYDKYEEKTYSQQQEVTMMLSIHSLTDDGACFNSWCVEAVVVA
jgi:hypothetical protein